MASVENDWFYTRTIGPGIWLIAEPQHVYSYLIEGSDQAALIDTGLNIAPIRPVAEALTDRPLKVINTHYHFDHIGGNHEFDEIAKEERPSSRSPFRAIFSTRTSTTLSGSSTRCRPIASSTQSTFGCSRARVSRAPSRKVLMNQRGRSSRRRRRRRWSTTTGSTSAGEC